MRTAMLVGSAVLAPVISRLVMHWMLKSISAVVRGWLVLLGPWTVVGWALWCFRPPAGADILYVVVFWWWGLWYVANGALSTIALAAAVDDHKRRGG